MKIHRTLFAAILFLVLAGSAAAQTQWPANDGTTAYARYALPTIAKAPTDAPTAGVVIPDWANRVVMEVRGGAVTFIYNATPTATVGVTLPAGAIIVWPFYDMPLFRAIHWYGKEAGSEVFLLYSRSTKDNS